MVLRVFAAHPAWLEASEIREAGNLLAARLYQRDKYSDRGSVSYWERVSFPFWFTDIVSSLDTLSRLGFDPGITTISAALARLRELQRGDGTFAFTLLQGKDKDLPVDLPGRLQDPQAVVTSARRTPLPPDQGSLKPHSSASGSHSTSDRGRPP